MFQWIERWWWRDRDREQLRDLNDWFNALPASAHMEPTLTSTLASLVAKKAVLHGPRGELIDMGTPEGEATVRAIIDHFEITGEYVWPTN